MELFPGNIDFAADNQGALSCCFFIVCETMFTMGESPAISHANDTEQQAQQVAGDPRWRRFSTETSLLSFHREQIEEDNREARETSLRTAEVMASTQRPQTCTEAATKYNNYTASETDEEREHRLPTLQKNDKEIRQRLKFVSGRFVSQPISPRKLAPTLWTISPQFLHD